MQMNKMSITVYHYDGSVPCGLVLLTARALNLAVDLKPVDLLKMEHMTPEYLKLNPMHKVPTLVDGDFVLWESRAIARYLAAKHGSTLYPQELKARAIVDQRLDFDFGTLFRRFGDYFYPHVLEQKPLEEVHLAKLQEALGFLNTFLEGSQYVAGADLTIADFAIVTIIATIDALEIDLKPFPNIVRWLELMKGTATGYQKAIQENVDAYIDIINRFRNGSIKWYRV